MLQDHLDPATAECEHRAAEPPGQGHRRSIPALHRCHHGACTTSGSELERSAYQHRAEPAAAMVGSDGHEQLVAPCASRHEPGDADQNTFLERTSPMQAGRVRKPGPPPRGRLR